MGKHTAHHGQDTRSWKSIQEIMGKIQCMERHIKTRCARNMVRKLMEDIKGESWNGKHSRIVDKKHAMERHTRHHHGQDAGYGKAFKKSCARYMLWEGVQELMGKRHCWGKQTRHYGQETWYGKVFKISLTRNMVRENVRDINGQYHGKDKHTRHQGQDTRYGKAHKTSWAGYMVWGSIQDIMGKKYGI